MMRFLGVLVIALAALPAGAGDKAEKPTTLGRVLFDKHEATVTLLGPTSDKDRFIVTVEVVRPKGSPKIKTSRLQIWMLRNNFASRWACLEADEGLEDEFLPQSETDKGTVTRGILSFDAAGHTRKELAALVVAVDGEPKAFKLVPAAK